ncbi:MAG: 50S ribosomal protein L30e [Thermoplasmata archaeon]|nr:50S ribosomal protein L30e [Thermoplasmata archaeon]
MIDIARALKSASVTGKVKFGCAETRKAVGSGEAKLVVLSSNCPSREEFMSGGSTKAIEFPGTNVELGAACGKPFAISVLAVVAPGDSNILSA